MESEVITAIVSTPAVLITAAAAWLAGRAQSQGAYQGPVDAVRRAAQREAYADLYRTARRFIYAWEVAETAHQQALRRDLSAEDLLPSDIRALMDQMWEARSALQHAADMVLLEGPEDLAEIAKRIWDNATLLAGEDFGPHLGLRTVPLMSGYVTRPDSNVARNEAMSQFSDAHRGLLPAARRYLNGGALPQG
ncbi:hypothetical protein AB0D83_35080 [Streptomyces decoyicus]|uniref:hypothetical protein n=1 Tax=Streptomyces decoyicus TaxID=249567 RepID=UPI0033F2F03D